MKLVITSVVIFFLGMWAGFDLNNWIYYQQEKIEEDNEDD